MIHSSWIFAHFFAVLIYLWKKIKCVLISKFIKIATYNIWTLVDEQTWTGKKIWNKGTRSVWNVKAIEKVRRREECSLSYKAATCYIIPKQTMARLAV